MAERHAVNTFLEHKSGQYRVAESVRVGDRMGLVLELVTPRAPRKHAAPIKVRHTVLLGQTFAPDGAAVGVNRFPEQRLLAQSDDNAGTGLGDRSVFQRAAAAATDFFVLNASGHARAKDDPGDDQDPQSEMFGTVPVACTCDDWKWRGVKHNLSRSSDLRHAAKTAKLRRFARNFRGVPNPRFYDTSSDNGLAARGGCRHMVWVTKEWTPSGRRLRQRRAPVRFQPDA